jgi:hypothetical protein
MGFLMKSQRAMLHHILETNQFNPSDFEIVPSTAEAETHETGDAVRLQGSDYYFAIYPNENSDSYFPEKFFVEYSPGEEKTYELELCKDWQLVCHAFAQYLSFLNREITTSDPWDNAEKFSSTLRSLPETAEPNAPVSELERKAIWKALGTIQATLLEHVGESEQKIDFVEQHFAVLKDAVTKFGRKDYMMLLYTTIIGIATTIGVPSYLWGEILQPLTQVVGNILKLLH